MACVHSLLLVPAAEEKVRGRERERRDREKTQRVISPTGLESVSILCSRGFQERGAQGKVTLGVGGCPLSPRLL